MSIKEYFVSRFDGGTLMEADYSQLEIRALAELSGDTNLKYDLDSGVDLHTLNAANWKGKHISDVTKEERRQAKTISFQLQYGASAGGIAKRMGIAKAEAQAFISAYEERYEDIIHWQHRVIWEVEKNTYPANKYSPSGYQLQYGNYTCPITKRRYTFLQRERTKFSGHTDVEFYAPEVKNYPVQGFATGDVVPMMLGKLMRQIYRECPDVVLLGSVHDSVLLDVPKDVDVYRVGRMLKHTLEDVPYYLKEDYGYVANNVFPVDVSVGMNWGSMLDITDRL